MKCRTKYANSEKSDVPPKADSTKRRSRSLIEGVHFKFNCFLCA